MKIVLTLSLLLLAQTGFSQQPAFSAETHIEGIYATMNYYNTNLTCEIKGDCVAIPTGSRACGGPNGYIISSRQSPAYDYVKTLAAITADLENVINFEGNKMSICVMEPEPQTDCVSNLCVKAQSL